MTIGQTFMNYLPANEGGSALIDNLFRRDSILFRNINRQKNLRVPLSSASEVLVISLSQRVPSLRMSKRRMAESVVGSLTSNIPWSQTRHVF